MNGVTFEMLHVLETYRVKLHSLSYVNANKDRKAEKLKSRLQKHFSKTFPGATVLTFSAAALLIL